MEKSGWKGSGTSMRRWLLVLSPILSWRAAPRRAQHGRYPRGRQPGARADHGEESPPASLSARSPKRISRFWTTTSPQQVAVFERHTEQPLSVALLIDTSGSTAKDLKYEIDSVARFLHALFAEGNPERRRRALQLQLPGGQAQSLHAQRGLARTLAAHAQGRGRHVALRRYLSDGAGIWKTATGGAVMVIVTDGGDTTSTKDFHAALEAAQLADSRDLSHPGGAHHQRRRAQYRRRKRADDAGRGHRRPRVRAQRSAPSWTRPSPISSRICARNICWRFIPRMFRSPRIVFTGWRCACAIRNCGCRRATAIMGRRKVIPGVQAAESR